MKRVAQVDLRQGELIILSYSRTKPGFWVMNGTYVRLPVDVADRELGYAVEQALSATRDGVPAPSPEDPLPAEPVLKEVGASSYSSYMRGVRSVHVEREASHVDLVPTRNEGGRGGFVELHDQVERLRDPTDDELGAAVRRGLDRAF